MLMPWLICLINSFQPHFSFFRFELHLIFISPTFPLSPSLLSQERGGMMALTEVYCLVNRARGMEVTLAQAHIRSEYTRFFVGLSDAEL